MPRREDSWPGTVSASLPDLRKYWYLLSNSVVVVYNYTCHQCGGRETKTIHAQFGQSLPNPEVPSRWKMVVDETGRMFLFCDKHEVEIKWRQVNMTPAPETFYKVVSEGTHEEGQPVDEEAEARKTRSAEESNNEKAD